jgi:hypothetical protein
MANAKIVYTLTAPTPMDQPILFKAEPVVKGGKPKYSGKFLFALTHKDLGEIKKLVIQCAQTKFPGKDIVSEWRAGRFAVPFETGEQFNTRRVSKVDDKGKAKTAIEHLNGMTILTARSDFQPQLGVVENGGVVDITEVNQVQFQSRFYPGVEVLGQIELSAYDAVGNGVPGVNAYLNVVLSTGKGKRLGSAGRPASDVFSGYMGQASTTNPTNEEIPF